MIAPEPPATPSQPSASLPPDDAHRRRAVDERAMNVVIDAGPGTGKTTILVERFVGMVAPLDDARSALDVARVAAITFTRRAAGELRLRIRAALLAALAAAPSTTRRARLAAALAGLDAAHVGTIHAFADRLLRQHPAASSLSPSYRIVEDPGPLVRETVAALLGGAEAGTLVASLPRLPAERVAEAEVTWRDAQRAGLRTESRASQWQVKHGLASLVADFLDHRDAPPADPEPPTFDLAAFRRAADELLGLLAPLPYGAPSAGARWLNRLGWTMRHLRAKDDPLELLRALSPVDAKAPAAAAQLGVEFGDDQVAWDVWRAWRGDERARRHRDGSLRADLLGPLHGWLAARLVRTFPVVVALYEDAKARHGAVDQLDLLLALRDVLRRDLDARAACQARFDHVFVDEFQDTDPLQAEIILFLCERAPAAHDARDVELAPGKLTIVGDPKQSIYRFRRADIAIYDETRRVILAQPPHLPTLATLSASFRAAPALLDFLNHRFARILGVAPEGERRQFDPASGAVFHQPIEPAVVGAPAGPRVHVVPFEVEHPNGFVPVERYRALEGRALARWLRWLVERSGATIRDPRSGELRPVRFGDVAVLAVTTTSLSLLFPALDELAIPHVARGGVLFLADPLHRQLLLALRAIADPDDGVAQAALYRPPFFAVDLAELVVGAPVADAARAVVDDLRRARLAQSPGATIRDLVDRTAFARRIAVGPNGVQRLSRVRELVHLLEALAGDEALDFDALTARARAWVDDPVPADAPLLIAGDAVQILTVHQAKGLEFPVVALWDGRGQWMTRPEGGAFRTGDRGGWMIDLDGLSWESARDLGLRDRERTYREAEKKRLVYVAATRARDLLAVPRAGVPQSRHICGTLLDRIDPLHVRVLDELREGAAPPAWAQPPLPPRSAPHDVDDHGAGYGDGGGGAAHVARIAGQWDPAAFSAAVSRARPVGVTNAAHATLAERADDSASLSGGQAALGRHGADGRRFGDVVHRALALVLAAPAPQPHAAAAVRTVDPDLPSLLAADATADVSRALAALQAALPDAVHSVEVPVAGSGAAAGTIVSGYIDLVSATPAGLVIIDFKTDVPPPSDALAVSAPHAAQLREYARLLVAAGVASAGVRCAVLYTADGSLRWLDARA